MPIVLTKGSEKRLASTGDDLRSALAEGYELPEQESFVLVDSGNKPVSVSRDDLNFFLNEGYSPEPVYSQATRAEAAAREEEFGGVVSGAAAAVEGAADALTLGGYGLAFGDGAYQQRALEHPTLRAGGEIVGTVASLGAGGVAKGGSLTRKILANTPAGLVGRASVRAGAKLAGTGTAARRVAGQAIAGTLEGAAFGAGQALSHAVINDEPLNVDLLMAGAESGAVLGGGTGLVFGTGAELIKRTSRGLRVNKPFTDHLQRVDSEANKIISDGEKLAAKRAGREFDKLLSDEIPTPTITEPVTPAPGVRVPLGQRLTRADLFKAGEMPLKEELLERIGKVEKETLENLVETPTPRTPADLTKTPVLQVKPRGPTTRVMMGRHPTLRIPREPEVDVGKIIDDLMVDARKEIGAAADGYKVARKSLAAELGKDLEFSVQSWTRRSGDDIFRLANKLEDYHVAFQRLDGLLPSGMAGELSEQGFLQSLARGSPRDVQKLLGRVQAVDLPAVHQLFGWTKKGAADRLGANSQLKLPGIPTPGAFTSPAARFVLKAYAFNRAISAKVAHHAVTAAGGAALGVATPLGLAGGTGVLLAARRILTNKVLNRALKNPLGQISGLERRIANAYQKITESLDSFARGRGKRIKRPLPAIAAVLGSTRFWKTGKEEKKPRSKRQITEQRMSELAQAASNPNALRETIDDQLIALRANNIPLALAVARKYEDRVNFLHSKMPQAFLANPLGGRWLDPPDDALYRWGRMVRAAENPMTLLDELNNGSLSVETVETVKALYPALLDEIRFNLVQRLPRMQQLSYEDRVQLSVLFEVPVDESFNHLAGLQTTYQAQRAAQAAGTQASHSFGTPKPQPPLAGQEMGSQGLRGR